MIGGLIEQQEIGFLQGEYGQSKTRLFAAAED